MLADILSVLEAEQLLSPIEKIGQCFMPAAFINDSEAEIQKLENLIQTHNIGAICFFHSRASAATNFEGKKEVVYNSNSLDRLKELIERYQKASKYPLLIAIDAEWGLAMRIEETPQYPYALTLGAVQNDTHLIYEVGRHIGMDCKDAGIHWNLAPAVDINNNPQNPVIGYRSFGDDPQEVFQKAKAYIDGMKSTGILNSIKHFPGHGDTAVDSHLGLPKIVKSKEELFRNEIFPFQKLVEEGVDSVMVGHLAVPSLSASETRSATISKKVITEILREELNHNGIVITDALNMHSVSKLYKTKGQLEWEAFDAGNDVLCFAENVKEGIETILKKGNSEQVNERFRRIWKLKERAFSKNVPEKKHHYENLMEDLAQATLTELGSSKELLERFHREGFDKIQVGSSSQTYFFNKIKESGTSGDNVLLAVFPRKMKPTENFGLSQEELHFINRTIVKKNVMLYLFGNPYTLRLLDYKKCSATLVAYQAFKSFQDNAAHHFLGKIQAQGKLPVSLH